MRIGSGFSSLCMILSGHDSVFLVRLCRAATDAPYLPVHSAGGPVKMRPTAGLNTVQPARVIPRAISCGSLTELGFISPGSPNLGTSGEW